MRFLRKASSFINSMKSSSSNGSNLIKRVGGMLSKISMVHVILVAAPLLIFATSFLALLSLFNYKINLMQMADTKTNKANDSSSSSYSSTGGHQEIIEKGKTVLGAPYSGISWGNDPSGFTCSGFTWWSYQQAGFDIPIAQGYYSYYTGYTNGENSQMWAVESRGHWKDNIDDCNPGDLVFYSPVHDKYQTGHVAIYMGNNEVIEADFNGVEIDVAVRDQFVGCGWPLD